MLVRTTGVEAGDPEVVAAARAQYAAHRRGDHVLPGDLLADVYATVVSHGDLDTTEQLMDVSIRGQGERLRK